MKVKLHNNNSTDFVIYEGETIEEIREQAKDRIKISGWEQGWSEEI